MPKEFGEKGPGFTEKSLNILRNAGIAISAIALFLGNFNVAAISAIGAIVTHAANKYMHKK